MILPALLEYPLEELEERCKMRAGKIIIINKPNKKLLHYTLADPFKLCKYRNSIETYVGTSN